MKSVCSVLIQTSFPIFLVKLQQRVQHFVKQSVAMLDVEPGASAGESCLAYIIACKDGAVY
jgi:hypothetical protein